MGMKDRGLRIMRGWIGALVCTCLAAASHTLADGIAPPVVIVGLVLAISGAICTALAGTNFSLLRTTLAVLLSQGLYHSVFGLFGHHAATGQLRETGAHAGHGSHTLVLAVEQSVSSPADVVSPDAYLMPVSHLLAAVLTIAALRKGELATRSLLDSIMLYRPRALLLSLRWQPPVLMSLPIVAAPARFVLVDVLLPTLRRRGPPAVPAFAYC